MLVSRRWALCGLMGLCLWIFVGRAALRAEEPASASSAKPSPLRLAEEATDGESAEIQQVQQEVPLEPSAPPAPTTPPAPFEPTPPVPNTDLAPQLLLPSLYGPAEGGRGSFPRVGLDVIPRSETLFRQTTDAGDPIGKSPLALGATTQKRTPIINAPLVRGKNAGDLLASGSFWFPARQDLDTLLSKIDSRLLSDLVLIKGPYSSRFGPGFSFIDAELLPAPRFAGGYESHGSTSADYKTNGQQFYGRQSVWGGAQNWGFRVGYGHRTGNDYESGNGTDIPASYKWRDLDVAVGYDPKPTQHLDAHYLRVDQTDVELPGQIFDINYLVSDAVEVHWTDQDPNFADFFTGEAWYNRTRFAGDSQRSAKRRQIPILDALGFFNTTDVDLMSTGYTFHSTWGKLGAPQLTVGTDLRYLNQEIQELNRFRARGFNATAAAADPTFVANGVPALFPVPTGNVIPAGPIPGSPRPEFNSDLIFPFFQPSAEKLVPRSHSANPGLFVEALRPVGERGG